MRSRASAAKAMQARKRRAITSPQPACGACERDHGSGLTSTIASMTCGQIR